MRLSTEIKKRLQERKLFEAELNALLGIRPQMKVSKGGNTSSANTFDLRSLNQKLIKKW